MVPQASSAKRIGGTTWHTMMVRKGASTKRAQSPATVAHMSAMARTLFGSDALTQTCLAVPARQA